MVVTAIPPNFRLNGCIATHRWRSARAQQLQRIIIARQLVARNWVMLPLTGVRILAVEQYGAGPFGSMQLADMGAEVIKIENPAEGGDVSRSVGPYFLGEHDSHFFQAFNRNKRSMTLNLRAPEGQHVLYDLAATGDAVLDNLRGDQSPRLGVPCQLVSQSGIVRTSGVWPRGRPCVLAGLRLSDTGGSRIPR
jgi:hypothetical protein